MPFGGARPCQPVFDLVAAHGQERHQEPRRVDVGDPRQIVVNDLLDRRAGGVELGIDAVVFGITQRFLLVDQAFEAGLEIAHGDAQRRNNVLFGRVDHTGDAVERFHRQILAFGEILGLLIGRPRDVLGGRGAHHQQCGFEIAAGVGDGRVAVHAVKGAADLEIAGHIGKPDGEDTDHGDGGQHDDAGSDRQLGEHFWHGHGDRSGTWLPRRIPAAFHASKTENG